MLKSVFLLILFSITLLSKTLIFGVVPYKSKNELFEMYTPLTNYLSKELNSDIKIHIAKDYDNLFSLIKENQVDFAILGPFLYVQTKERLKNIEYLATATRNINGKDYWSYESYIVTLEKSSIETIQDLKGKSFAFTDKNSTSGFLYPISMIKNEGINYQTDFEKVYYLKKHDRVIDALIKGSIDAGAAYDEAIFKAMKEHPMSIRVLKRSKPIPNDSYIATTRLTKEERQKLKKALLGYKNSKPGMELSGFVYLKESEYDSVKEVSSTLKK